MLFRWLGAIIMISCLAISMHFRARARRSTGTIARRSEPMALIAARIFVALPVFAFLVAAIAFPRSVLWAELKLPDVWRWLGVMIGVGAVPMTWWVFRSIGSNISETVLTKRDHQLVTHGPYRWVRHPLYSVGSLLLLSLGLTTANIVVLGFALLTPVFIHLVILPAEERALIDLFGERYESYRRKTGALVPRIWERR